ncbi:hypothetical protein Pelo_2964 [Pelomyxa schiedti]|nr:hypothetical protein Pelo_2964 [Pelomyxa schiedti]
MPRQEMDNNRHVHHLNYFNLIYIQFSGIPESQSTLYKMTNPIQHLHSVRLIHHSFMHTTADAPSTSPSHLQQQQQQQLYAVHELILRETRSKARFDKTDFMTILKVEIDMYLCSTYSSLGIIIRHYYSENSYISYTHSFSFFPRFQDACCPENGRISAGSLLQSAACASDSAVSLRSAITIPPCRILFSRHHDAELKLFEPKNLPRNCCSCSKIPKGFHVAGIVADGALEGVSRQLGVSYTWCMAHRLALVYKHALDPTLPAIQKLRSWITELHRSYIKMRLFKQHCESLGIRKRLITSNYHYGKKVRHYSGGPCTTHNREAVEMAICFPGHQEGEGEWENICTIDKLIEKSTMYEKANRELSKSKVAPSRTSREATACITGNYSEEEVEEPDSKKPCYNEELPDAITKAITMAVEGALKERPSQASLSAQHQPDMPATTPTVVIIPPTPPAPTPATMPAITQGTKLATTADIIATLATTVVTIPNTIEDTQHHNGVHQADSTAAYAPSAMSLATIGQCAPNHATCATPNQYTADMRAESEPQTTLSSTASTSRDREEITGCSGMCRARVWYRTTQTLINFYFYPSHSNG